jgi:hypothetical protein
MVYEGLKEEMLKEVLDGDGRMDVCIYRCSELMLGCGRRKNVWWQGGARNRRTENAKTG